MAIVHNNDLTEGLRGKIGKQLIFRKMGKYTIAYRTPVRRAPYSQKQIEHRLRFKRANEYAKTKLLQPGMRAKYREIAKTHGFYSAHAAVVSEFMKMTAVHKPSPKHYETFTAPGWKTTSVIPDQYVGVTLPQPTFFENDILPSRATSKSPSVLKEFIARTISLPNTHHPPIQMLRRRVDVRV